MSAVTIQGIFIMRARIAVWELAEPFWVTMARILSFSNCTVSLGARSSARIITGSGIASALTCVPLKIAIRRPEISLISAARPRI